MICALVTGSEPDDDLLEYILSLDSVESSVAVVDATHRKLSYRRKLFEEDKVLLLQRLGKNIHTSPSQVASSLESELIGSVDQAFRFVADVHRLRRVPDCAMHVWQQTHDQIMLHRNIRRMCPGGQKVARVDVTCWTRVVSRDTQTPVLLTDDQFEQFIECKQAYSPNDEPIIGRKRGYYRSVGLSSEAKRDVLRTLRANPDMPARQYTNEQYTRYVWEVQNLRRLSLCMQNEIETGCRSNLQDSIVYQNMKNRCNSGYVFKMQNVANYLNMFCLDVGNGLALPHVLDEDQFRRMIDLKIAQLS